MSPSNESGQFKRNTANHSGFKLNSIHYLQSRDNDSLMRGKKIENQFEVNHSSPRMRRPNVSIENLKGRTKKLINK